MTDTLTVKDGSGTLQTVKTINAIAPTTPVDRSGSIDAGGTAQVLMAENTSRRGLSVWNLSTTATLWINEFGTASAGTPSIPIGPGIAYETPAHTAPKGAVSIFSATTGVQFTAREW